MLSTLSSSLFNFTVIMNNLHAFWRMEYIRAPRKDEQPQDGSPFLQLLNLGDDRSALILWRGETSFIMLNKFPYNAGHLLVLPKREVADLDELTEAESSGLMAAIIHGKRILSKAFQPDGFNIGFNLGKSAGAGIPKHLHAHVVPRWEGDCNFMPVIGETRVLPQALEATWEHLRTCVDSLDV